MEKCEWCAKEVEGEVREKPVYHADCRGVFQTYIRAVEKLRTICSRVMKCADLIKNTPMEPQDALENLTSELAGAERQSKQCSELFVTRKGGT